jgi:Mn-dependent DtxR family transcriptional regulator
VEPTPIEIHPCAGPSGVEARYLLTILDLERSAGVPTQAEVARGLGVAAPTALEMIRRLRRLGFVRPDVLALTGAGKSAALVLSARRAAAHALVHDVLGIDDELSRREADELASAVSPSLGRRLLAGRGRAQRPAAKPL